MHPYGEARTRHPSIPPGLLARAVNGRSALLRERVDAVTAEVVPALAGGGVRALLLKGPATVVWLYDNEHSRSYVDTDVLVSPDDLASAGAVLRRLGFECVFDERDYGTNPHAQLWARDGSPDVDLHWQLPGIAVAATDAWDALSACIDRVIVAGAEVETLDAPGRALHLAIHAAYHQRGPNRALSDLERALRVLDDDVWAAAAALARRLRAEPAFGAGLRCVPSGGRVAERLKVSRDQELYLGLEGGRPRPGVYAISRVVNAGTGREALRLLARGLFPPRSYMRALRSRRDAARGQLASAYTRRLGHGLRDAPGAFREVIRARRREHRS
jgi:hypothetical protein